MRIEITLQGAPVTKKNHQRICINRATGRRFVKPSSQYEAWEEKMLWQLKWIGEPIAEKVNVRCIYYMPTKRRVDLVNLEEATLDLMVKAKVLKDDCADIVASMDGSCVHYDKERPRTEIVIETEDGTWND